MKVEEDKNPSDESVSSPRPAPERCADQAYHAKSGWGRYYQCERSAGYGPDGKYCRQHADKFADGETTTWYRASKWTEYSCDIESVEVLSESDKTLLVKKNGKASREKKVTDNYSYFASFEEAVAFYQARAEGLLKRAEAFQRQVKALKIPARDAEATT